MRVATTPPVFGRDGKKVSGLRRARVGKGAKGAKGRVLGAGGVEGRREGLARSDLSLGANAEPISELTLSR